MTEQVHIQLFGDFVVSIDGSVVGTGDFERRSGAELVQLLAQSPDRRLHRDQILDALWPDVELDAAKNRFYKAATFARKALGDVDAVVVSNESVLLFPHRQVDVDIDTVSAASPDDSGSLDRAMAIGRHELLPDARYADWASETRVRLRATLLEAVMAAGRWSDVLEIDATNEVAAVEIMTQALASGDRQAVLRRFAALEGHLRDELGVEPSATAHDLRAKALAEAATGHGRDLRPRLGGRPVAAPTTPTIGRQVEIGDLVAALKEVRLLSVVAPGGAGKTQLVRHLADHHGEAYADGVWMAELGTVADEAGVEQEVLRALGGRHETDTTARESILRALDGREALIVLDNCEHVAEPVALLSEEVLDRCPSVRLLATSRRPLGVVGYERVFRLGRLPPDSAAALFVAEARRHGTDLDTDDPAVRRMCAQLDQLPLAVRLAATRTRTFELDVLESMLNERFEILGAIDNAGRAEHQTLLEAIDWSINELDPPLRQVLAGLASFTTPFTLDAAVAVATVDDMTASGMANAIDHLVACSLVDVVPADDGRRYRLLESIRLRASDGEGFEAGAVRHLEYFVARAVAGEALMNGDSQAGLDWFRSTWTELRQAKVTAVAHGRRDLLARLVGACGPYSIMRLQFELVEWCSPLDPDIAPIESPEVAVAVAAWGSLARYRGESERAAYLIDRAAGEYGDVAEVRYAQAWMDWNEGDHQSCGARLRQIMEMPSLRPVTEGAVLTMLSFVDGGAGNDVSGHAHRLNVLAAGRGPSFLALSLIVRFMDSIWDDSDQALRHLDECQDVSDRHELTSTSAQARTARVLVSALRDDPQISLAAMVDAIGWTSKRGLWSLTLASLGTAASLFDKLGRTDIAVTLLSARAARGIESGLLLGPLQAILDRARDQDARRFDAWMASGASMSNRGAAQLALGTAESLLRHAD